MWHFAARQHCELIPRGIIAGLQVTANGSSFNSLAVWLIKNKTQVCCTRFLQTYKKPELGNFYAKSMAL